MPDEKVLTPEEKAQLRAETIAAITAAIRAEKADAGTEEEISRAAAAAVDNYLREHKGGMPEVLARGIKDVVITDKRDAERFTNPQFFPRMVLDQLALRQGKKPEFGTDFDELERKREEYYARTGVAVGASNSAGNFVPQELTQEWVNLVFRDGGLLPRCRRRPMSTDSLLIPTLTGGVTVYITPETTNTSDMATQDKGLAVESQITTGQVTLTRVELTARVLISRKTLRIAAVADDAVRTDMPDALRAFASKAITVGQSDTGGTISGLDSLVTTNVKTWNVAKPRRGLINAINSPGVALSGNVPTTLMVAGPQAIEELSCAEDGRGRPLFLAPGELEVTRLGGAEVLKDFNIPATYGGGSDSRIYGGDFSRHANVGMEDAMYMLVNPYSNGKNGLVEILMALVFGWVPSSEKCFWYMNVPTA